MRHHSLLFQGMMTSGMLLLTKNYSTISIIDHSELSIMVILLKLLHLQKELKLVEICGPEVGSIRWGEIASTTGCKSWMHYMLDWYRDSTGSLWIREEDCENMWRGSLHGLSIPYVRNSNWQYAIEFLLRHIHLSTFNIAM
jgi:hypothetical protein